MRNGKASLNIAKEAEKVIVHARSLTSPENRLLSG
jgi:hypothetical protein